MKIGLLCSIVRKEEKLLLEELRSRGMDFQEWIKYDIEYVENISWRLDCAIIWETICVVVRGVLRT